MIILGTNSIKDTGFDVANSCRFNSGSSDYLNNTSVASVTNRLKFTISLWVKRSTLGAKSMIGTVGGDSTNFGAIWFDSSDRLNCTEGSGGGTLNFITNRVFRDVSAWYNIILAIDTTQGTESNRVKIYVNGVQETSFSTSTYPGQNSNMHLNRGGKTQYIGRHTDSSNNYYFDGYMTEVVWVDGQQLSNTDLGEFDEDSSIWKPIDVSGLTFGNNGFYLDFENSSALGNDVSGNNNDFTVNNLTAVDQSTDTCSNNFCTLNPLNVPTSSGPTFSEGNLVSISTNANFGGSSTIGMTTGKWYCEAKCVTDSTIRNAIGITGETGELARDNNAPTSSSSDQSSIGYLAENGNKYNPAAGDNGSSYGDSYANDDIIGIAMDLDNMKLYFSKNGTFQNSGDPTSGATGTGAIDITVAVADTIDGAYFVCQGSAGASTSRFDWNFGSPPYAVSSGNSDGNGHGNFEYSVPSGYLAWCTKNLGSDGG